MDALIVIVAISHLVFLAMTLPESATVTLGVRAATSSTGKTISDGTGNLVASDWQNGSDAFAAQDQGGLRWHVELDL
ncbi:hypothetical protein OHA25_50940 [Nonomuraea sp. NBC_00507]|uniref:hypothetical protein n=1 Tax=Nonomuraea sp. NBC_00507 TaxID=2976002 RepID=UPI002E190107